MMSSSLVGKVAFVTGASGGIGMSVAEALTVRGVRVILSGRRQTVLEELARNLEGAVVCVQDLKSPNGVLEVKDFLKQHRLSVDIFVNNAGMTRDTLALRVKERDWEEVMCVNLKAGFFLAQAFLRNMVQQSWGRIISISSVVGTTGNAGQTVYAASKAGLGGWTKSMAREVAKRGITVNCVAPGYIQTDMTKDLPQEVKNMALQTIPMGVLGTAEDVAQGVVFLAGQSGQYITGQTLHINGGMVMV